MNPTMSFEDVVAEFGPLKRITLEESERIASGKVPGKTARHLLGIMGGDVSFDELPEEERPTAKELKEMGATEDDYSQYVKEGAPGHHFVNVDDRFVATKPMPLTLRVTVDDWSAVEEIR